MKTNLKILTVLVAVVLLLGLSGSLTYAGGKVDIPFNPRNFWDPLYIDNEYSPLPAGTTFWYHSVSKDGCEVNPVKVTYRTKTIARVTTRVVHDQVYEDVNCNGEIDDGDCLTENTLDYYAQDNDGNVWYFGEYTESYDYDENDETCTPIGEPDTEGSWEAGVDGAEPGIVMLAEPTPGAFYKQEYQEDVAEDMAKVLRLNARVELTFDNNELEQREYEGCLMTKEWSPLERGAIEHKYYCPDARGLVLINELQGGTVRTELISIEE